MTSYAQLSQGRKRALKELKELQAVRASKERADAIACASPRIPAGVLPQTQRNAIDFISGKPVLSHVQGDPGVLAAPVTLQPGNFTNRAAVDTSNLAFGGVRCSCNGTHIFAGRTVHLRLSSLLSRAPELFDERKISAVNRLVTDIDQLPVRFKTIKALYLSKNFLQSLDGVAQFHGLSRLSAADNRLAHLEALEALAPLAGTLTAINFEGNPMSRLPNYRAHVLLRFPGLRMLDGQDVGADELQAAPGIVRHESAVMSLMLANACLAHKLRHVVGMMAVHHELRMVARGPKAGTLTGSTNPARLLQLWEFDQRQTAQEREAMCHEIRKEVAHARRVSASRKRAAVATGSRLPAGTWEAAYAQVMLAQQECITERVNLVEEAHQQACNWAARMAVADPGSRRACAQQDAVAGESARRWEREALIGELRGSLVDLASSSRDDYREQAMRYETRMEQLQAQMREEAAAAHAAALVQSQASSPRQSRASSRDVSPSAPARQPSLSLPLSLSLADVPGTSSSPPHNPLPQPGPAPGPSRQASHRSQHEQRSLEPPPPADWPLLSSGPAPAGEGKAVGANASLSQKHGASALPSEHNSRWTQYPSMKEKESWPPPMSPGSASGSIRAGNFHAQQPVWSLNPAADFSPPLPSAPVQRHPQNLYAVQQHAAAQSNAQSWQQQQDAQYQRPLSPGHRPAHSAHAGDAQPVAHAGGQHAPASMLHRLPHTHPTSDHAPVSNPIPMHEPNAQHATPPQMVHDQGYAQHTAPHQLGVATSALPKPTLTPQQHRASQPQPEQWYANSMWQAELSLRDLHEVDSQGLRATDEHWPADQPESMSPCQAGSQNLHQFSAAPHTQSRHLSCEPLHKQQQQQHGSQHPFLQAAELQQQPRSPPAQTTADEHQRGTADVQQAQVQSRRQTGTREYDPVHGAQMQLASHTSSHWLLAERVPAASSLRYTTDDQHYPAAGQPSIQPSRRDSMQGQTTTLEQSPVSARPTLEPKFSAAFDHAEAQGMHEATNGQQMNQYQLEPQLPTQWQNSHSNHMQNLPPTTMAHHQHSTPEEVQQPQALPRVQSWHGHSDTPQQDTISIGRMPSRSAMYHDTAQTAEASQNTNPALAEQQWLAAAAPPQQELAEPHACFREQSQQNMFSPHRSTEQELAEPHGVPRQESRMSNFSPRSSVEQVSAAAAPVQQVMAEPHELLRQQSQRCKLSPRTSSERASNAPMQQELGEVHELSKQQSRQSNFSPRTSTEQASASQPHIVQCSRPPTRQESQLREGLMQQELAEPHILSRQESQMSQTSSRMSIEQAPMSHPHTAQSSRSPTRQDSQLTHTLGEPSRRSSSIHQYDFADDAHHSRRASGDLGGPQTLSSSMRQTAQSELHAPSVRDSRELMASWRPTGEHETYVDPPVPSGAASRQQTADHEQLHPSQRASVEQTVSYQKQLAALHPMANSQPLPRSTAQHEAAELQSEPQIYSRQQTADQAPSRRTSNTQNPGNNAWQSSTPSRRESVMGEQQVLQGPEAAQGVPYEYGSESSWRASQQGQVVSAQQHDLPFPASELQDWGQEASPVTEGVASLRQDYQSSRRPSQASPPEAPSPAQQQSPRSSDWDTLAAPSSIRRTSTPAGIDESTDAAASHSNVHAWQRFSRSTTEAQQQQLLSHLSPQASIQSSTEHELTLSRQASRAPDAAGTDKQEESVQELPSINQQAAEQETEDAGDQIIFQPLSSQQHEHLPQHQAAASTALPDHQLDMTDDKVGAARPQLVDSLNAHTRSDRNSDAEPLASLQNNFEQLQIAHAAALSQLELLHAAQSREDKIEQLGARALKRRALRHLLTAIQQYLRKQHMRQQADALQRWNAQMQALHAWTANAKLRKRLRRLAEQHSRGQLKAALQAWKLQREGGEMLELAESAYGLVAVAHCAFQLQQRALRAWRIWLHHLHRPSHRAQALASAYHCRNVLFRAVEGWRSRTQLIRIEHSLISSAVWFSVRRLYHKALKGWVQQLNWKRRRRMQSVTARAVWLCHVLTKWRMRAVERAERRRHRTRSCQHRCEALCARALASWHAFSQLQRLGHSAHILALAHHHAWCQRRALHGFRRNCQTRRRSHAQARHALTLRRRHALHCIGHSFIAWRMHMRSRAHRRTLLAVVQDQAVQWRVRRMWNAWARLAAEHKLGCSRADQAALMLRLKDLHQRLVETMQQLEGARAVQAGVKAAEEAAAKQMASLEERGASQVAALQLKHSEELQAADQRLQARTEEVEQQMLEHMQAAQQDLQHLAQAAQAKNEVQMQLSQQHVLDLQREQQHSKAAEETASSAQQELKEAVRKMEDASSSLTASQDKALRLERTVQCLRKRLARRTQQLERALSSREQHQQGEDGEQQLAPGRWHLRGTMVVQAQERRPATAPEPSDHAPAPRNAQDAQVDTASIAIMLIQPQLSNATGDSADHENM